MEMFDVERIEKPLIKTIQIGDFKFTNLTTNNIIICRNSKQVKLIRKGLEIDNEEWDSKSNRLVFYDRDLLNMTPKQFREYIKGSKMYRDRLLVSHEHDRTLIQFRHYAIQLFYVTISPASLMLMNDIKDVWFVNKEVHALADVLGSKKNIDKSEQMLLLHKLNKKLIKYK